MSMNFEPRVTESTASVLPDSMRSGIMDIMEKGPTERLDQKLATGHPLESRLASWDNSQLNMKLHMQRQIYGLHAPMRTMMEIKSVQQTPSILGSRASLIQRNILMGKDETLDVAEIFDDISEVEVTNVHSMLAARLNV
ncbi:hypothetical protein LPJ78_003281 [Coemansia sp. RSA 989]|nr:proteasome maturation factor UMP1-domain-containing protein [Coemansia mojavensis]KAJ1740114.1 hypothetical protein LPJ68_004063 [Coemansia sp. RSA 1086]KAJ1752819.1 hypothetical protein LPJ79_000955 [Coemansia sp. RSA 1821]KAJ1864545.1 hypothetical protein LPJ78_003281 [Coemansia sp. RSA 989]KAJ1875232.1 hypothetical protein LPJ55_000904 [Coemansia sp. RSA 990]KAJ2650627.1 hypothetical protein IWW40_002364 [Coemansia sp. RSA 1250]KAJ2671908.1 hypothetical protein IWW42_003170 [Coemansia s